MAKKNVRLNGEALFEYAHVVDPTAIINASPDQTGNIYFLTEKSVSRNAAKQISVWQWKGADPSQVFAFETTKDFHYIQPISHDQWLLVEARPLWTKRPKNASLYSSDGLLLKEFKLGDAIASVQTTSAGKIWTSYFDEGVCMGGTEPEASGLNCWSAAGELLFKFTEPAGIESMADCYALNVASNRDTWLYYYMDFPLVHLRDLKILRHYKPGINGASTFAVWNQFVLFGPGYGQSCISLVELRVEKAPRVVDTLLVQDEEGATLKPFAGRGENLYFRNSTNIYRVTVEQALNACY